MAAADEGERSGGEGTTGLYVHIPFCERVCPYCDFAVVAANPLAHEAEARYLAAVERELEVRAAEFSGRRLATLYLGGGTPSLVAPERLGRLIERARAVLDARPESPQPPPAGLEVEITLEVNPSTLERARLPAFRDAGVNRLSIGIQSFSDATLKRLGRAHRAQEGVRTLEAARAAGFENISVDLILGAPGQSLAHYRADLERALAFAPEHLSIYELTIEEGTPFELANRRGQLARAGEDDVAEMLEWTAARTRELGLERYEISSYARPGFESRHNRRYWRREGVLGVGMGAWSYREPDRDSHAGDAAFGLRRANPREMHRYLEWAEAGAPVQAAAHHGGEHDPLTEEQARGEAIFLGLRQTTRGVDAEAFAREFGAPPRSYYASEIDRSIGDALLIEDASGDLRLTESGLLLSDSVFARFIA